jgi:uncharacterized repeat protein (TIGR02543 family)
MSKRAWFNGATAYLRWDHSALFEGIGTTGDFKIKFKTHTIDWRGGGRLLFAGTQNIVTISDQSNGRVSILDVEGVNCFPEDDHIEHTLEFSRTSGVLTIKLDEVVKYSAANSYDWAAVDAAAQSDGHWYLGQDGDYMFFGFLSEFEFYNGATRVLYLPLTADFTDQSGNAITIENFNNRVEIDEMDKVTFIVQTLKGINTYKYGWHKREGMLVGNLEDWSPSYPNIGGMLYLKLATPIPAGATITSAYLTIATGGESVSSLTKIRIRAYFSNNATFPMSLEDRYTGTQEEIIATEILRGTDFGGVINNLTVSYVDWDDVPFVPATLYNTPSLVSMIQELANLGEVSHIVLFVDDMEGRSGRDIYTRLEAFCREFHSDLVVAYTTGGPYNVAYRDNGGAGSPATSSHTTGSTVTVSSTIPSRDGYTFAGWNTVADGSGTSYDGGDSFVITSHVVLYAQWASIYPISSDVFFVGYSTAASNWVAIPVPETMYNPGAGNATEYELTKTGFAVRFVLSTPIPMGTAISSASLKGIGGLHFSGFQTGEGTHCRIRAQKNVAPGAISDLEDYLDRRILSEEAEGVLTDAYIDYDDQTITNGEAFEISSLAPILQELANTGDVSSIVLFIDDHDARTYYLNHMYSIYSTLQLSYETAYTVTYNGNGNTGGSVPVDGNSYAPGAGVTVLGNLNSLTRTDYAFSKWNTAADGSGTDYNPGDTFNIAANTTLYAKWQVVTPNVVTFVAWDTVNECGKTGDAANITVRGVADGVEYTLVAPAVTEVDATNLPGIYTVSLTDSENHCNFNTIGGKSSTTGIAIIPISWKNQLDMEEIKEALLQAGGSLVSVLGS